MKLEGEVLYFTKLSEYACTPTKATRFAAGYDLMSAYDVIIHKDHGVVKIETDIKVHLPPGTYARLASRSGLTLHHGIVVVDGVLDWGNPGPVSITLINHSNEDFQIRRGDRIAQLICTKICYPELVELPSLSDDTPRGSNGFGASGIN